MVNTIIESGYLLRYTDASRRTPRISFPCFSIHLVLHPATSNLQFPHSKHANKSQEVSSIMPPAVHILFVIYPSYTRTSSHHSPSSGSSSPPTAFPPPLSTHRPNLPQHQGRQPSNGCCWLPFRPVCSSIHDKLRKLGGGKWVCGVKNGVLDRIMARALSRK